MRAQLLHANPSQLLWELRLGHSCLGKFRAQHLHPSSPTSSETRRSTLLHPLISDFHHQSLEVHSPLTPSASGANANKKCLKWLTFPVTELSLGVGVLSFKVYFHRKTHFRSAAGTRAVLHSKFQGFDKPVSFTGRSRIMLYYAGQESSIRSH